MFLPYTIGETGKYVIAFFFLPAILVFITSLTQGKRQVMACDIFVWAGKLMDGSSKDSVGLILTHSL